MYQNRTAGIDQQSRPAPVDLTGVVAARDGPIVGTWPGRAGKLAPVREEYVKLACDAGERNARLQGAQMTWRLWKARGSDE